MHRWDSRLRPPPVAVRPLKRANAATDPTPAQLKGPDWRRSSQGLYVPAAVERTPGQRILEAAALLPAQGAVSGWGSAYWRGVRLLDGAVSIRTDPVLLCLGCRGHIRRRPGVRISREKLPADEVESVRGVSCATPLRTAFDGARLAVSATEAVVFVDMVLTAGLVTHSELVRYVHQRAGWKGVGQARRAVDLAVAGSRSPPETRLRLLWLLEAGLPAVLVNPPVFDLDGRLLGYPDALEPMSGAVLEYDGDGHRDLANHTRDNIREELFEAHGLTVMRATRLDLGGGRAALVTRMRRTHARAVDRDSRHDRWTLESPL